MTISGLSACFAQLPTFSPATNEQLQPFIEQLHFVDSVVGAATNTLSTTIADCFSKNFLYAVILPALTQVFLPSCFYLFPMDVLSFVCTIQKILYSKPCLLGNVCSLSHSFFNRFHLSCQKLL